MDESTLAPVILLIEDNPDVARMVVKLLSKQGFVVHHAATALSGLQMARQTHPNLVLVDLGLPDLSGNVVALQLSHMPGQSITAIAAFTAETGVQAQRIAKGFGCNYYITKPIDTQTFPDDIRRMLNPKESQAHGG